jgi:UDP-GlcNAc3NAcA epimerase
MLSAAVPNGGSVRIVSIVGARPEFVQVAVLSKEIRKRHQEILVHTGQHYDDLMSGQFFEELGIPRPDINLGIGPGTASEQTAGMLREVARALGSLDADIVIVRGDTNSTLAGALAAKQLLLPLAHVEAGMRSYDRTMPEELNRVVVDHVADVQFVTDESARERLRSEGIERDVHVCGDVMYDLFLQMQAVARQTLRPPLRAIAEKPFVLLTLHRAENTDDRARLASILAAFEASTVPVLFPIHPRTKTRLAEFGIALPTPVVALDPLGYLEIVALESAARTIFTDSGGVQREAYFSGVPCVTLRDTTEWTNTVDAGWNRLAGSDSDAIAEFLRRPPERPTLRPDLFGDGHAAANIAAALDSPDTMQLVARARATRRARDYAAASER